MGVSRAAIVGWGDVAVIHAEAIEAIDGVELVGVADTDPARREACTAELGVPTFASIDELVDAVGPEVIHVATPHDQHVSASLEALERGVHVIQEKPLAHTLEDGQRLVEAAKTAKAKIGICLQNRYNVSSQMMRLLLDSGKFGRVHGAYASVVWTRTEDYYLAKPWRGRRAESGGGLLINQAIHTLDLVQWFLGDVVDIKGHVGTNKFADVIEVEDTAEMLLTHESGVRTAFYATLTAPLNRPVEIELDCERAYVVLRDGLSVTWKEDGRMDNFQERKAPSGGRTYWGVSHELLIRDFYEKVDDPEPFWISPAEAMKSLEILKRTYALSGR